MTSKNSKTWFAKAKLTLGRTLTHLKSHETSPKSTYATFFVKKVPKKARKGGILEISP